MKSINEIIQEINEQIAQGSNGYELNTASVDINEYFSLFIYIESENNDNQYYTIELIKSESTEIIETSDCKIEELQAEIERLFNNNILEIDSELLSIDNIESFENSFLIHGYYDEKYFGLDITNNNFSLLTDDTNCTDEELSGIFKFIMEHKDILLRV